MTYAKHDFDDNVLNSLKDLGVSERLIHFAKTNIEKNDVAHWFDHVSAVIRQGLFLAQLVHAESTEELRKRSTRIIAIAALMHDTACWMDRDRHHDVAADWILNLVDSQESLDFYGLSPDELVPISICIREHRASWPHKRTSLESDIVSAADRGDLTIEECLRRSYLYGRFKKMLDRDQAIHHACEHIEEKFGVRGYAYENLPALCLKTNDILLLRNQAMDKQLGRAIIIKHRDAWEKFYQEVKHASD
jgi:hypothetical protein